MENFSPKSAVSKSRERASGHVWRSGGEFKSEYQCGRDTFSTEMQDIYVSVLENAMIVAFILCIQD